MSALEQRCRRLVKKWRERTWRYSYGGGDYAGELEKILPKRKAKKGAKR